MKSLTRKQEVNNKLEEKYKEVIQKRDEFFKALSELGDLQKAEKRIIQDKDNCGLYLSAKFINDDNVSVSWGSLGYEIDIATAISAVAFNDSHLKKILYTVSAMLEGQTEESKSANNYGRKKIAN